MPVCLIHQWKGEILSNSKGLLTEEDLFILDSETMASKSFKSQTNNMKTSHNTNTTTKTSKTKKTTSKNNNSTSESTDNNTMKTSSSSSSSSTCSVGIHTKKIYIVPYSMIGNINKSKLLDPNQFGLVIADESHHLKNKETVKSSTAIPFLKKATIAICLTGTPATNRPVELYGKSRLESRY